MSKFVTLVAFFFGSVAFACPDLSGTYICEGEDGKYEATISQKVVNGVTVYTMTEDGESTDIAADGKPITSVEKDGEYVFTMQQVASCTADALKIDVNMTLSDDSGNVWLQETAHVLVSLDASRNLKTVVSAAGETETAVCVRK